MFIFLSDRAPDFAGLVFFIDGANGAVRGALAAFNAWTFLEGRIRGRFERPSTIREVEIDPVSGALAVWGCPGRKRELFLEGTVPREVCPSGAVAGSGEDGFKRTRRLFVDWLRRHL